MNKKPKSAAEVATIAGKLVSLLDPLASEDRHKVIKGALTLLGETAGGTGVPVEAQKQTGSGARETDTSTYDGLPSRAADWMRKNGLSMGQIEEVFDISSDGVPVIASEAPGKNGKEKTRNAYVLQGISRLLASGDATFDDKNARQVCDNLGCYDKTNHSKYIADKGNLLTGSKNGGWKLTAPGVRHGALLVKELTKGE